MGVLDAVLSKFSRLRPVADGFEQVDVSPSMANAHQGYTTDGTHHFTIDSSVLARRDAGWAILNSVNPITGLVGVDHAGDGQYHAGKLYIPVGSYTSIGVFGTEKIAVYDSTTLARESATAIVSGAAALSGVTIDPDAGIIYGCMFSNGATSATIRRWDLDDFTDLGSLTLDAWVLLSQGIAFKDGLLYLSGDRGEVTVVDATTGAVQGVCLTDDDATEHEGIDYSGDQLAWVIGSPTDAVVHLYEPTTTSSRAVTPDRWGNVGVGAGPLAGLTLDATPQSSGFGRAAGLRIGRQSPFEAWLYDSSGGLRFDGHLSAVVPAAATFVFGVIRSGGNRLLNTLDSVHAWALLGDGKQEWGAGGSAARDTNLYRAAANQLQTDDTFIAADGIVTKVKAGTPVDGDFATAPPNGTLVVDSTTLHLWIRVGGAWVDLTATLPTKPSAFMRSGVYYTAPGISGTATFANGNARAIPLWVPRSLSVDRIGIEVVTTPGSVGALIRLGIYSDDGNGFPGAVLLDAGTVDPTSTGVKELTINQALTPGLYWLTAVVQGAPVTTPVMRTTTSGQLQVGGESGTTISATNAAYQKTGVTGALPAWGSTVLLGASAPRVFVRAA